MVHGRAPIRRLSDLAGKSICFYQGSNAHRHLEGWMAAHRLTFVRMGYMEYGELYDAYNAGVCDAQVGESPDLAAARLNEAARARRAASLPSRWRLFPIFAATPASDPQWSAIVAWAVFALERAELPATPWAASGLDSVGGRGAGTRPRRRLAEARRRRGRILRRHLCAQPRRRLAPQASPRAQRAGRTRRPVRHAVSGISLAGNNGACLRVRLPCKLPCKQGKMTDMARSVCLPGSGRDRLPR